MKHLILALLTMVLFVSPAFAGTKTLTFIWNQDIPTPVNDLAGWRLYQSPTQGGSCKATKVGNDIAYTTTQTEYTTSSPITVPDGQRTTLYFSMTAFDTSGNESGCSNEVAAVLDFQSPGVPIQLRVTITTP